MRRVEAKQMDYYKQEYTKPPLLMQVATIKINTKSNNYSPPSKVWSKGSTGAELGAGLQGRPSELRWVGAEDIDLRASSVHLNLKQ